MRIQYIDSLKGAAILLVIIGHICSHGMINSIIYSFHMALFFMLSGIVCNNNNNIKDFLIKKARTLLLPFVTFVLLHSFIFKTALPDIINDNVKDGLWFLYALFFMQVTDQIAYSLSPSKLKYLFISLLVSILLIITKILCPSETAYIFSLSYIATNYPFYLLGRLLKEFKTSNNYLFNLNYKLKYESFIQFTALSIYFVVWVLSFYYGFYNEVSNMILRFTAVIGIVMLFKNFASSKYNKLFAYIGKYTLSIYLLHFFS